MERPRKSRSVRTPGKVATSTCARRGPVLPWRLC
jgi:hypothetical protein